MHYQLEIGDVVKMNDQPSTLLVDGDVDIVGV